MTTSETLKVLIQTPSRVFLIAITVVLMIASSASARPKLVLQITVDQLRGDMPIRFQNRLGPGGLRYLMSSGVYYTNAHYRHSATFTGTGHATLATGADPAQHGIVGNDWYSIADGKRVNCVEDANHTLLGEPTRPFKGTSPALLLCSTIGDELILATSRASRVFAVSIKDRAAILPAGRLGKAFWYSDKTGRFVTSTYYYDQYPAWIDAFHEAGHADKYASTQWRLLGNPKSYVFRNADDRPFERAYRSLGRTFPHPLSGDLKELYAVLRFTPMGDEYTLTFVKELMRRERIGQAEAVDMLAVSFSATDAIGHAFGPNSLEAEDNLLRLDQTLTDLFAHVDKMVGLDNTIIVLSSDHGVDAAPELVPHLEPAADAASGRLEPIRFITAVNEALAKQFGVEQDLVVGFWNPCLYLDLEVIREHGLDVFEVEKAIVLELSNVPGIAHAITRTDLLLGRVPDSPIMHMVQRSFHLQRSGHVFVVQSPGWYMHPKTVYSSMHGSPWSYDTYVPIVFAGHGLKRHRVHRRVGPESIASTLALVLGIAPPSGNVGEPLIEVIQQSESGETIAGPP